MSVLFRTCDLKRCSIWIGSCLLACFIALAFAGLKFDGNEGPIRGAWSVEIIRVDFEAVVVVRVSARPRRVPRSALSRCMVV